MMDFNDFDRMFSAYQKNVDQVGFGSVGMSSVAYI